MKARMKKLISISIPVLALALLVVLGSALAGPARDPVTIYGSNVDLTAEGGPLGDATLTIRGDTFSGTVRIGGEAPPEPTRDGLYYPAATHFFDFGKKVGTLKMLGEEYLVATDEDPLVFTLHGNAEIIEATGVFEGVSGELRISATINRHEDVMEANFHANGVVSGYGG